METQSLMNLIAFVASVASLIVSIGAIWLSIVFYRLSTDASKATTEAAKGIGASVERLEKLFDKLYSDTFSMMRDTVSDMRKHIWPTDTQEQDKAVEEVEKKADEKITALQSAVEKQVSEMLQRQKIADDKMGAIRNEVAHLLTRAIESSRQVESEAREETLRDNVLRTIRILQARKPKVTVDDVISRLRDSFPLPRVISELEKLKTDGRIVLDSDGGLGPETEIRLQRRKE